MLPQQIFVHSTHHKAGTVLFQKLLKNIADRYDGKYLLVRKEKAEIQPFYERLNESEVPMFCLDSHSFFNHQLLRTAFKASHMVRDPRDILVSGYFYHLSTTEKWCITPKKEYKGLSYQEHLKSLPKEEGITTELLRMGKTLIQQMRTWDYNNPLILEMKFEELSVDFDGTMEKLLAHYGFVGKELEELVTLASKHDVNRMTEQQVKKNKHITNKERKKETWRELLNNEHIALFKQHYGDLLISMGYEKDLNW